MHGVTPLQRSADIVSVSRGSLDNFDSVANYVTGFFNIAGENTDCVTIFSQVVLDWPTQHTRPT
jgi:hypothetical protein